MLHYNYKTVVMTSMGITVISVKRKRYAVKAASSSQYLVTADGFCHSVPVIF